VLGEPTTACWYSEVRKSKYSWYYLWFFAIGHSQSTKVGVEVLNSCLVSIIGMIYYDQWRTNSFSTSTKLRSFPLNVSTRKCGSCRLVLLPPSIHQSRSCRLRSLCAPYSSIIGMILDLYDSTACLPHGPCLPTRINWSNRKAMHMCPCVNADDCKIFQKLHQTAH